MKILRLIKLGFFFGLGLSVAAWAAYAAAYAVWPKQDCSSSNSGSTRISKATTRESIELTGVEEHKVRDRVYFTGIAKNNDQVAVNSLQIEVNLFKGGRFVDQYSAYLAGSIAPGESRYFKVTCDCRDLPAADYDNFKTNVTGGF